MDGSKGEPETERERVSKSRVAKGSPSNFLQTNEEECFMLHNHFLLPQRTETAYLIVAFVHFFVGCCRNVNP